LVNPVGLKVKGTYVYINIPMEKENLTWEEFEERIDRIFKQIQNLIEDTYGQK